MRPMYITNDRKRKYMKSSIENKFKILSKGGPVIVIDSGIRSRQTVRPLIILLIMPLVSTLPHTDGRDGTATRSQGCPNYLVLAGVEEEWQKVLLAMCTTVLLDDRSLGPANVYANGYFKCAPPGWWRFYALPLIQPVSSPAVIRLL